MYEQIDSLLGKPKGVLYLTSRQWVSENFTSANDVVHLEDKEAGKIIGRFSFKHLYQGVLAETNYAPFSIECRNNKVRIQMYDFLQESKRMIDTVLYPPKSE